jgi:hypothetical protein
LEVAVKEHPVKIFPTIGCCGLDCGLCPRYYTVGSSRCPGCAGPGFFEKHPSCGYITCCVKKKGLEVCAQCGEFHCAKFESWAEGDSFVTHQKALPNLDFIRKQSLEKFLEEHRQRISLLRTMLDKFDDGRSRSFYCIAATLLPIADLEESLRHSLQQLKQDKVTSEDTKTRTRILRGFLKDCAAKTGVALKLRHKKGGSDGE